MSESRSTDWSYRVPNKLAREYLERQTEVSLTESTANTYDGYLTEFVQFLQDRGQTVLKAQFTDIIEYIEYCVRRGNRRSTINSKLSTIRELYRYIRLRSESASELEIDPIQLSDIDLDQYNTPPPIERVALSREELRRLFDAFDSYRNRLMAITGVETGLRNSDIRNLRLEDINNAVIHVRDPKNSRPYDVPISSDLEFELDHWRRHHRSGYAASRNSPYVFPSQNGEKLQSNSSLNQIVKSAAKDAGLQGTIGKTRIKPIGEDEDIDIRKWSRVTVHTLRHSFVTLLKDAEVDLTYRMLVANHKNAETTRNYTHGDDGLHQQIRKRFDPPR